jgi:3-oxoacyl-[acyl-carrier protein] reductase
VATERLQKRIRSVAEARGLGEAEAASAMARDARIARFGEPEQIASIVAFLVSPRAAFIQGAVLDADGGQTRTL